MAAAVVSNRDFYRTPHKQLPAEDRMARLRVLQRIAMAVEPFEFADEKPYDGLADSMAVLGNYEGALRLARQFGKGPIKFPQIFDSTAGPYILACIGACQGKTGRIGEARETFREALEMVRRDPRSAMRLGLIALSQAEAGDVAGASRRPSLSMPMSRFTRISRLPSARRASGDREGRRRCK